MIIFSFQFIDEIRSLTLNENGNEVHIFDDNGDGRAGYRIYVVSNKDNEEVKSFNTLTKNLLPDSPTILKNILRLFSKFL